MAIQVTLRSSNTDDVSTAAEVTFYVKGITPLNRVIGDVGERVGGTLVNRKGVRPIYQVECWPATVRDTTDTGAYNDQGTLTALDAAMKLKDYLWLYSVTGSQRVTTSTTADFWDTGLPVAVALVGDPLATPDFGTGAMNYSFDLEAVALTLS